MSVVTEPSKRRWISRVRFSLRTLLCGVLLIASGIALWLHWEPWSVERTLISAGNNAVFSPDGQYVATSSFDETVRVWSVQTGQELHKMEKTGYEPSIAFSPDSQLLIVACCKTGSFPPRPESMIVWNVYSGKKVSDLDISDGEFDRPRFCRDASSIVSDRVFCLWDTATGTKQITLGTMRVNAGCSFPTEEEKAKERRAIENACAAIDLDEFARRAAPFYVGNKISEDGSTAITSIWNGQVQVWETASRKKIGIIETRGFGMALSKSGDRIAFRDGHEPSNRQIEIWNTRTTKRISAFHAPDPECAVFSRSGDLFAAASLQDPALRIWDVNTGRVLCIIPDGSTKISIADDERRIAVVAQTVAIRDIRSGDLLTELRAPYADSINCAVFSPNGERMLISFGPGASIFVRRHPEWWWGVACLPEFWSTILFFGLFVWSVRCDRKAI